MQRTCNLFVIVCVFIAGVLYADMAYSYTAADFSKTFYGDANGDMSIQFDDAPIHKTQVFSGNANYDTPQPQTTSQKWNTCDINGDLYCMGDDLAAFKLLLYGSRISKRFDSWEIANVDLPGAATAGIPYAFHLSVRAIDRGVAKGRPGIVVKLSVASDSPTQDVTIRGRSCQAPGSKCALSVSVSNWSVDTHNAPTEDGTNGFLLIPNVSGVVSLVAEFSGQPLLNIPAVSTRFQVNVAPNPNAMQAIRIGYMHTCSISLSGVVKCWGINDYGQLGDNSTTSRLTPVNAEGLSSGVTDVATGRGHSCAVTSTGGVKCWGYNNDGQLGNNSRVNSLTPVDVVGLASGIIKITAGNSHTCALTSANGVKCWGRNNTGQLGDNSITRRLTPVNVVGLSSGVVDIVGGENFTCALTSTGGMKCWGDNTQGQLGDSTQIKKLTPMDVTGLTGGVAAITAGYAHSCAVTSSGAAKCWGDNSYGKLGDNTVTRRLIPTDVMGLSSGVSDISAGYNHSCALISNGTLKCWGSNATGQLGDGTLIRHYAPADVLGLSTSIAEIDTGSDHSCAITTGGTVKCWGSNNYGQIGDGGITSLIATPTDNPSMAGSTGSISAGSSHTCTVTLSGGVKCWGDNSNGQLGDNTTAIKYTPVDVIGLSSGVIEVQAGGGYTCALTSTGGVKCWGYNFYGQLGNNSITQSPVPVDVFGLSSGVIHVVTGGNHTCALTATGGVKCWGYNANGQLGNNSTANSSIPVDVAGLSSGVLEISAGFEHTCAVTSAGGAKCWGFNVDGQLGDNSISRRLTPVNVSGLSSGVVEVKAGGTNGGSHTCALTSTGGVKCWGLNLYGQLGDNSTSDSLVPVDVSGLSSGVQTISVGGGHTCALTATGLKCWGDNMDGQIGDTTTTMRLVPADITGIPGTVVEISTGWLHTCAVTSAGDLKVWGSNFSGELGIGSIYRLAPVDVVWP